MQGERWSGSCGSIFHSPGTTARSRMPKPPRIVPTCTYPWDCSWVIPRDDPCNLPPWHNVCSRNLLLGCSLRQAILNTLAPPESCLCTRNRRSIRQRQKNSLQDHSTYRSSLQYSAVSHRTIRRSNCRLLPHSSRRQANTLLLAPARHDDLHSIAWVGIAYRYDMIHQTTPMHHGRSYSAVVKRYLRRIHV